MGDRIDADLIRAYWDDILRLLTSLRTRSVSASLMLHPRMDQRRAIAQDTIAELNKGGSWNILVRAVNLHRLGRFRDRIEECFSIRASALNLFVLAIIRLPYICPL